VGSVKDIIDNLKNVADEDLQNKGELAKEVSSFFESSANDQKIDDLKLKYKPNNPFTLRLIKHIFDTYVFPFLLACLVMYFQDEISNIMKSLSPSSGKEVKNEIKKIPTSIDFEFLSDIRIVTGKNVRIRADPALKKENIMAKLKIGTVVTILEKQRTWSLVEATLTPSSETITGWVSNRYLLKLKR